MSQLSQGDQQALVDALHRFAERTDRLLQANGSSHSNITINAGGVGVWIAVTCCIAMTMAMIVGCFWVSREFSRADATFNDLHDKDSVHDAYIQKLNKANTGEKK